jgi:SnoaL-like domain
VDAATLQSIFTDDVVVQFPAGSHQGIAGLPDFHLKIIALWERTLHQVTSHHIVIDGDRASAQATLTATHVHRDDDPGRHLRIGGYIDASAIRATDGWLLTNLTIRLVWTEGDAPAGPADGGAPLNDLPERCR